MEDKVMVQGMTQQEGLYLQSSIRLNNMGDNHHTDRALIDLVGGMITPGRRPGRGQKGLSQDKDGREESTLKTTTTKDGQKV